MSAALRTLVVALIAVGTMFGQSRLSVRVGIGRYGSGYYPLPVYARYVPSYPGSGSVWVDGYWGPQMGRTVWMNGYWRRPYYSGYRAPRYYGFSGYYSHPRYYSSPRYYTSYRERARYYDRERYWRGRSDYRDRRYYSGYRH